MSDSTRQWRTVEELYHAAAARPPADRDAFLRDACPDAAVRRQVQSLLAAQTAGDQLLERPALDYAAAAVTPGAILGVYRVEERIGAGGMGEVYRATDTRLQRSVALKVLPSVYASDPDWLARFQREARVLASLNHPNIASIYGLEGNAVVMELVEGPTLADRLQRGPLPDAVKIARQVAEALEYAHEKGIIHRDLKPANVKLSADGAVKVLDFGLAKVATQGEDAPTLTATRAGAILGTPAYMSPEQAQGQEVDRRADIWAFGVLLFEMVSGRRMFDGANSVSVLAAVVRDDPPWQELPAATPPAIVRLLRRCLDKDPKQRLRDIGEARIALQNPLDSVAPAPAAKPAPRYGIAAVAVAALAVAGAILGAGWLRQPATPPAAAIYPFLLPEDATLTNNSNGLPDLTPSPDGKYFAFSALVQGKRFLFVQALSSLTAQRLDRTQGAHLPFWSPDSKSIGFFAQNELKRSSLTGEVQVICSGVGSGNGATWNAAGDILYAPLLDVQTPASLMRVPATGGNPVPVTRIDPARGEKRHSFPQFLPDGKHFLYHELSGDSAVFLQELGQSGRTLVVKSPYRAVYAAGYLLFARRPDRGLPSVYAQPFDWKKSQLHGQPVAVVAGVDGAPFLGGLAFHANAETLTYREDLAPVGKNQMTWYDRAGRILGTIGDVADYSNPALSPDGAWLAVGVRDPSTRARRIMLFDLTRGTKVPFTTDPSDNFNPTWSPDGKRIAFSSDRRGHRDIYIKDAFGTAAEQPLIESEADKAVEDWSADGRWISLNYAEPGKPPVRVTLLSPDTRQLVPYLATASMGSRFSPDGKWMAYRATDQVGRQMNIQPLPATGPKWQISAGPGFDEQWRADGKELFYADQGTPAKIMAVDIAVQNGAIKAGVPRVLFTAKLQDANFRNRWVVTRDGQKFLVLVAQDVKPQITPFFVIHNWTSLLEKR